MLPYLRTQVALVPLLKGEAMPTALLSPWLLLTCCLLASPTAAGAGQADWLRRLSMRRPPAGIAADDTWANLDAAKVSFSSVVGRGDGQAGLDKVAELPGQPEGVDFDQYAGYVTVDSTAGRALFYYLVESPQDAHTKPLVLWLNGGPGCSALGNGAMAKLGPFRVKSDGKTLFRNNYAWNNVANVLFLESPAGVGFSYSNTTSDYNSTGDKRTAVDTYVFLLNWLDRFPRYKTRDFFITGESYGGHYVPQLAFTIISNNRLKSRTRINLRGIAIGNAYLDGYDTKINTNTKAMFDYYWTHALISDEAYAALISHCKFPDGNWTTDCLTAVTRAGNEVGSINPYNIYAPRCHTSMRGKHDSTDSMAAVDPCLENYVQTYLNLVEVKRALHANLVLPYPWSDCSKVVGNSNWKDMPDSILPIIRQLMKSGLRLWLYSGDLDAVDPVTSTKYSLNELNLPIKTPWRPWIFEDEVAGYVVEYEGLVFVTVRGAGHMVPKDQPGRALTMFISFLQGKLPPPS